MKIIPSQNKIEFAIQRGIKYHIDELQQLLDDNHIPIKVESVFTHLNPLEKGGLPVYLKPKILNRFIKIIDPLNYFYEDNT